MSVDPLAEKFNIVSNDYGRMHKCDFSVFEKKNIRTVSVKLKFGTKTNSNMQNSVVLFTFSYSDWKYSFSVNLVQKIKTVSLSWNSVPRLIRICRIQWCCPLFRFRPETSCFLANLVQRIKIVNSSWNLVPTLIRTSRIQWCCSFFLFYTGNTLFRKRR